MRKFVRVDDLPSASSCKPKLPTSFGDVEELILQEKYVGDLLLWGKGVVDARASTDE